MKLFNQLQYTIAGWLSLLNAILTIFMLFIIGYVLLVILSGTVLNEASSSDPMMILVSIFGVLIDAYILFAFKKLLHKKYHYKKLDKYIFTLISSYSLLVIPSIVSDLFIKIPLHDWINLFVIIFMGIAHILFGVKLLRISNTMYGLRNTLSINSIGIGITLVSIILVPVALIFYIIYSVILGIILLRAADDK